MAGELCRPQIEAGCGRSELTLAKKSNGTRTNGQPIGQKYVLSLYVSGATPRSLRALENIKRILEEHLAGCYDLEVIDIYKNPARASGDQIIAAPTLLKKLPLPLRQMVGDLSDQEKVLFGLDLRPK